MSSDNDTQDVDGQLRIDSGTQVLVSTGSMQRPLSLLPATPTGNVLVVSSTAPATIERRLRDRGIDLSSVGVVPVTGSDIEYDGPLWVSEPVVPDDLTGLSMRVTSALDALQQGRGWVLVDCLNALAMYADPDRVCRCFEHLTTTVGERALRGVYTVTSDALDEAAYNSFKRSVDRTLDSR